MIRNVAIRTDASAQIGTGHVMRCLSLADGLSRAGASVRFVCRTIPSALGELIRAHGHQLSLLPPSTSVHQGRVHHARWLEAAQADDAAATRASLIDQTWDWLVVDHYALDEEWERAIRPIVSRLLVIDDLADRVHECDALLDQNLSQAPENRYAGKVPSSAELWLGPSVALLREEFLQQRREMGTRSDEVTRVLVSLGGADAENRTAIVLEALADQTVGLHVDVVVGRAHPTIDSLERSCCDRGYAFHIQTREMGKLVAAADIAIGAGGVALWERCCLGLPTLTLCAAENQRDQIENAARSGLVYAPRIGADLRASVGLHFSALRDNPALRARMSYCGMQAVDGAGVERIVQKLAGRTVTVRYALPGDAEIVFAWRNAESVRKHSRNTEALEWAGHLSWFRASLKDPTRTLLIGRYGQDDCGVLRFDYRSNTAEVSIFLAPGYSGRGLGGGLLAAGEAWLRRERPDVAELRATVLGENMASHHLFSRAGFGKLETKYTRNLYP